MVSQVNLIQIVRQNSEISFFNVSNRALSSDSRSISPSLLRNNHRVQKRQSITNQTKREIRTHVAVDTTIDKRHKTIASWVNQKYDRKFNFAQITVILNHKFDHVEISIRLVNIKNRVCTWSKVKNALYEWQQARQRDKVSIFDELLQKMTETF